MTSILIFAGSARQGAFSKQLAAATTAIVADDGCKPTLIDLADFDVPLYNADLETEAGIPQPVIDFRHLVASHAGMIIATPEYNGFVTPLLLNMLC
jgi:chromate reductase